MRSVGTKKSLLVFLMYELMLQPLSDKIMKTGQPKAPRKESWGSRKAPIYMKKAPGKILQVLLWQNHEREKALPPPLLILCLFTRGRRRKKRQKARLSDAMIRDTVIALGNGDTLHVYYTMIPQGMQGKTTLETNWRLSLPLYRG